MLEAQWQQRITDYCDLLGLKWHHETDSRRSKEGFPDLVIAGPGGIIFVEVKTDDRRSRITAGQQAWLDVLHDAPTTGVAVRCWRPRHWVWVKQELDALAKPA